jgi:hypothetical protein
MTRERHVRFCERLGVKLLGATLPAGSKNPRTLSFRSASSTEVSSRSEAEESGVELPFAFANFRMDGELSIMLKCQHFSQLAFLMLSIEHLSNRAQNQKRI